MQENRIEQPDFENENKARKWSPFYWWEYFTGEPMRRKEKIFGVIFLAVFLLLFYIVLDANKYSATVHVIAGQGKVGVNPTTEVVDFGDLSPGTAAVRRIDIMNRTPVPVYVMVVRLGSINDLMKLDRNYFVLGGHAQQKLEFSVYMPASAPIDATLSGRVFIFKIPIPWKVK